MDCGTVASIIVVDNEPLIRDFLAELLRAEGFAVSVAFNGEEALRLADRAPCDLMMLDVNMPGLGGWETLALLRGGHPELKVLIMSGTVDHGRARAAGANGFIQKPYHPAEVLGAVRSQLSDASAQ